MVIFNNIRYKFSYLAKEIQDSIIIGNEASVEKIRNKDGHSGHKTLALGNKTKATLDNSVALGYLSETDYDKADLEKPGYTARGSYSILHLRRLELFQLGNKVMKEE